MTRTLRPFFSYYGGKWRSAVKHYPAPEFGQIVEPFAGSAGYALRYPDRRVVLCDTDPVIASLWQYLIQVSPAEIMAIPDVPDDGTVADLNLCPEAQSLVGFWLNRGSSRPCLRPSKWMRDRVAPGSFWGDRVRHTVARQLDAIRHWKVYNCSYEDCPAMGTSTYFVDPPYQKAGRHYRHGADRIDYDHLGRWCRDRVGQVIVCENEGATWLPFRRLGDMRTTRTGRRSIEAIWTNTQTKEQGRTQ